jgi:hypothetical protein
MSTDTMYDATPGGVWSSGATSVATVNATTGVVSTLTGGTAKITYTLPSTGCEISRDFPVNFLPSPTVTYDWVTNTFFTDTFYYSYQWYDSLDGMISGATAFQTAALYNGYYWVVVTDTNGCTGASIRIPYNTSMAGVATQTKTMLRIYPNPANEVVYIESGIRVKAVISSVDGKTEMEQADAKELDISKLASGMYFISLYTDNGQRVMVQKLVKQ